VLRAGAEVGAGVAVGGAGRGGESTAARALGGEFAGAVSEDGTAARRLSAILAESEAAATESAAAAAKGVNPRLL
jgi:hypothetical protein